MITRRTALTGIAALAGALPAARASAQADAAPRRVPGELSETARTRPALVPVGGAAADVVFVEFFDYNCPVCRATAAHIAPLVAETGAGWLLANYPILGDASHEAARIALGYLALEGPEAYRTLHAALLSNRGVIDGGRVLDIARDLGADVDALGRSAALPGVGPALDDILRTGRLMGFEATPTTLVGPWAYEGYLSLAQKIRIVADLRA